MNAFNVLERHAYARGDIEEAALYAQLDDAQRRLSEETAILLVEAQTGFPAEDCLHEAMNKIEEALLGSHAGKEVVKRVMKILEETQVALSRSAEYGNEQIEKYMKEISK